MAPYTDYETTKYSCHLALDVSTHMDKINLWKDFANILVARNLFENSKQFLCFNNEPH